MKAILALCVALCVGQTVEAQFNYTRNADGSQHYYQELHWFWRALTTQGEIFLRLFPGAQCLIGQAPIASKGNRNRASPIWRSERPGTDFSRSQGLNCQQGEQQPGEVISQERKHRKIIRAIQ
jgi:hypothetical protein